MTLPHELNYEKDLRKIGSVVPTITANALHIKLIVIEKHESVLVVLALVKMPIMLHACLYLY